MTSILILDIGCSLEELWDGCSWVLVVIRCAHIKKVTDEEDGGCTLLKEKLF